MKHLDLFSGIGGFALACELAGLDMEHVFCEIDPFCQKVLKKNFPNSKIYGDIKTLASNDIGRVDLLTGGFPCQPFSVAGKQRAQEDDRYLWPEMLRVIRETRPTWIIGENVAGIINLALEQVCLDLENEGYEVQPFIIPACAVNAPHRRDRVWIVANARCEYGEQGRGKGLELTKTERPSQTEETERHCEVSTTANASSERLERRQQDEATRHDRISGGEWSEKRNDWGSDWAEVATELCGVDDGLPVELDGFKLTKAQHRAAQLKAYGNAIVPQVAAEITKAIFKA